MWSNMANGERQSYYTLEKQEKQICEQKVWREKDAVLNEKIINLNHLC